MVVDYSKWDKLELSDDSDVEVHPNVDKKSFIRWKQRDIHEKREQAKFRTLQLEVNIETNQDLLARVEKLIKAGENGRKVGLDVESDVAFTQEGDSKLKPAKATSPEQPRYTDMIESMLMQIVAEDGKPEVVLNKLKEHKDMIEGALRDEGKELAKLEKEKKQHITADDIRTGWDSTIVYKSNNGAGADAASTEKGSNPEPKVSSSSPTSSSGKSSSSSSSTIETLNKPREVPKPKVNEDGLEELLPDTAKFGELPVANMEMAFKYLMAHQYIVTEGQKDALMMSAFEHELAGETKRTEQVVWNALLLQYCNALGKDGVPLFFSKVTQPDHPARKAFEQDWQTTSNHIKSRCKILGQEYEKDKQEGPEETIQLHAVDPDTELIIGIPEEGSDGYSIYEQLPPNVKEAINTKQLDKINEVLATLNIEEAEDLVGKLSESGVLQVENKIYDPKEWEQKRREVEAAQEEEHGSLDEVD